MPEESIITDITVRTLADGATAQLRVLIKVADREEARRIYTELLRISATLARKHEFPSDQRKAQDDRRN